MSAYKVIPNPNNYIFKFEVWYKGVVEGQDANGYKAEVEVCKVIKKCRSQAEADAYIQYQKDIASFKGGR